MHAYLHPHPTGGVAEFKQCLALGGKQLGEQPGVDDTAGRVAARIGGGGVADRRIGKAGRIGEVGPEPVPVFLGRTGDLRNFPVHLGKHGLGARKPVGIEEIADHWLEAKDGQLELGSAEGDLLRGAFGIDSGGLFQIGLLGFGIRGGRRGEQFNCDGGVAAKVGSGPRDVGRAGQGQEDRDRDEERGSE